VAVHEAGERARHGIEHQLLSGRGYVIFVDHPV
jgi:hypothetical protein